MSLTKPIPKKMREELSEDPFMQYCCLGGFCEGRTEWHHALQYAGKRVNEKWAILPLCTRHHKMEAQFRNIINDIMVSRATEEELRPYCKATDYIAIKRKYENNN